MRQLRRWKRLWRRSLTCSHTRWLPWGLSEVVGTVPEVHCNRRRLLRRGLEFHVFTINKSAHTKKFIWWSSYIYIYIYISSYIYIYIYIYMCVCVCVCVCVCISLNNIDMFCLHTFVYILPTYRTDFMLSGGNWLMKLPLLIVNLELSARSRAIIRGVYIAKAMWLLHVHYYLYWCVIICLNQFGNWKGHMQKYIDKICLYCSRKYALMNKCCTSENIWYICYLKYWRW